ncbi:MAG: flagellar basal-body MS-ring/collar protein FliF [Eubacteriales bacterium]
MNEQLNKTMQPLKQFWNSTSSGVKQLIGGLIAIVLVVSMAGSFLLNQKDYVVIFDQLTVAESTEILAQLQDMNVSVKVNGSTIMVPKNDESRIRMALATAGYPKSGLSYYLIQQGSGMLSTDYDRKQYVNMQLQERIGASIKTLDGVKDAIVTITIPEDNVFYLQEASQPSSASVIIHMNPGTVLTQSQIAGIQNLVAKSVAGLSKDNIAISDSQGNDLVGNSETSSSDYQKVSLTNEIENDLKKKILAVLEGPYESSKLRVSVTAKINTNNLVKEETIYTPSPDGKNSGVISSESSTSDTASGTPSAGGVAGTSSNSTVPTYQTTAGTANGAYLNTGADVTYQVSQSKAQSEKIGPEIESISIGIAVDKASFAPGEQANITQLVAFATGVSPAVVSVQNFTFFQPTVTPGIEAPIPANNTRLYIIAGGGAGVLILILAVVGILLGRKKGKKVKRMPVNRQESLDELFGEVVEKPLRHIPPKNDVRKQEIQEFSRSNPEIAAQLIKSWLKTEQE